MGNTVGIPGSTGLSCQLISEHDDALNEISSCNRLIPLSMNIPTVTASGAVCSL